MVLPFDRRLCVFFDAGSSRYCIEASAIAEVATPDADGDTVRAFVQLRDLSALLGGEAEHRPGEALLVDERDALALRVARVHGVRDVMPHPQVPLSGRLIPLLSPAVRAAVLLETGVAYELDPDGIARGLPRQSKRLEPVSATPTGPCLRFFTADAAYAVPIEQVKQVVTAAPSFNAAPGQGAFLGVVAFQMQVIPVFALAPLAGPEALVVLVELAWGELVGLSAGRADGVRAPAQLEGATALDLARTFS